MDIEEIKEIAEAEKSSWQDTYDKAKDDLFFLSDDEFAQWDEKDYYSRVKTGRPALTIDQLGQFIHQVANDIRMNTPTINVIPSDSTASEDVAEIYKGLIKEIEYRSNADDVYDTASLNSIKCSIGFIRVDHEYKNDTGFEQQLVIKRVTNPLSCWIDSSSVECDGRDAKHGFVIEQITVKDFKRRFPKFEPSCFESTNEKPLTEKDTVSICEFFYIEETPEEIESPDGKKRQISKRVVKRLLLSGKDILDETIFPGKYIPIVPVYGEESWVDGKRRLYSLIRKSKSAQKMFNYWKSLETELLMKAPQAPVMAAVGQVEDFAEDWKNPSKSMVLRYHVKDSDNNIVGPPQRLEPPTIPVGIVNAARQTVDDIKATMGIYNAGLGMIDNAVSGTAIKQRQGEGDVATYHFADNLVRSITQVGRILVSAIPVIYDTPQIIKTIGLEEETKDVGINGALALQQPITVDIRQGQYDVRVVTGASYTTRRQEAAEFLSGLVNTNPDFMKIVGDLLFKNLDFSGAHAMSERIKKVMDPSILSDEKGQDPAVMQLTAQLQEMQAMMAALQQQLNDKNAELQLKAQSEQNDAMESKAKLELEALQLQMKREEMQAEMALRSRELALKEEELKIKILEMQANAACPQGANIQQVENI